MPGKLLVKMINIVRSSIKWKLILIIASIILLVVSTLSMFTFGATSKTIQNDVQQYSAQILRQANLNLNRYFLEYEQGFLTIGVSKEFRDWLLADGGNMAQMYGPYTKMVDNYIRPFAVRHPEILSVTLLNSNGNEMRFADTLGFDMGYSMGSQLDKLSGMQLNDMRISVADTDYYIDNQGNRLRERVISLTQCFVGLKSYTRGYVKVDISLDPTDEILGNISLGANGAVLIADPDGNVVTGTGPARNLLALDPQLAALVNSSDSGSLYRKGTNDLVIYSTIPYAKWKTIAIVPYRDISGSIVYLGNITVWITAAGLAVAILLVVVFAGSITGRLEKLRGSIRQVREGRLDNAVAVKGIDEVSYLGEAYNSMLKNLKDTVHDLSESRLMQQESILSALQSQIDSHFLYNSLESINSMASLANQKGIERVAISLSKMLRYTSNYRATVVRLEDELAHVENYMEIIRVRYGDLVGYDVEIENGCRKADCLKVIVQPVVENCVRHGVEATGKPIHIGISANMPSPGRVLIRVSDDGTGFGAKALVELREKLAGGGAAGEDKTARHIGLANIQNRLRMHYKDPDAGVSVRNRQGGPGAVVEIAFPAHFIAKGEEA